MCLLSVFFALGLGRRMREAATLRQRLRQVLSQLLPGLSTTDAYSRLKSLFVPYLAREDLFPFCDAVQIERGQLPLLLSPDGVFNDRILPKHWKAFYENQVFFSPHFVPIPPALTVDQQTVLRRIAAAIRARCGRDLSSQWQLIVKHNPSGACPGRMPLSAMCHVVRELGLAFDPAALIDALLVFFGQPIECMDFNQFAAFLQAFDEQSRSIWNL